MSKLPNWDPAKHPHGVHGHWASVASGDASAKKAAVAKGGKKKSPKDMNVNDLRNEIIDINRLGGDPGRKAELKAELVRKNAEANPDRVPATPASKSDQIQARIDHLQAKGPDYTGAATASIRQGRDDSHAKQITHLKKQLRDAKNAEQSRADAEARAARSPEQKAADSAREAENGRNAQIKALQKTIADHPNSIAAQMAQEKLDRIQPAAAPPKVGTENLDKVGPSYNYPSKAAHTDAIIAAKRADRLAAGHGPAVIPKGKALDAKGNLVDATNKVPVHTAVEAKILERVAKTGEHLWVSLSEDAPTLKAIRKLAAHGRVVIKSEGTDVAGRTNVHVKLP